MKTLLLMRHAKSSWDDPALSDHDRPLNARGVRDAPRMGAWLRVQQLIPDYVTCSTAVRAQDTAQLVAEACGWTGRIVPRSELYHAGLPEWQRVIRSFPDPAARVLCVGHNPGLEELAGRLAGMAITMPTAAIAAFRLPFADWGGLDLETHYELLGVWRPKELADAPD